MIFEFLLLFFPRVRRKEQKDSIQIKKEIEKVHRLSSLDPSTRNVYIYIYNAINRD